MPIYEYKCDSCDHQFEEIQKFSDDPLTKCPKCGNDSLEKMMSTGGTFLLKGESWARDGYRNKRRT